MKLKTGFPQQDEKESTWCPWEKLSWPCNSLPAVPQAVPGVFKSLLPQPSSFHLCLVEGRFVSVIFKLETLQMPTFADQLAAGMVPVGRHRSHGDAQPPVAQLWMERSIPCFPLLPILSTAGHRASHLQRAQHQHPLPGAANWAKYTQK
uniref:Uncharacterized protein n=1 Tax=Cyanistes caeruleus TaxID=156563 RepID=A0A8C0VHF4_CYACU